MSIVSQSLKYAGIIGLIALAGCGPEATSDRSQDAATTEYLQAMEIEQLREALIQQVLAGDSVFEITSSAELESLVEENLKNQSIEYGDYADLVKEIMDQTPDDLAHVMPALVVEALRTQSVDPGDVLTWLGQNMGHHSDTFVTGSMTSVVDLTRMYGISTEVARQISDSFKNSIEGRAQDFTPIVDDLDTYVINGPSQKTQTQPEGILSTSAFNPTLATAAEWSTSVQPVIDQGSDPLPPAIIDASYGLFAETWTPQWSYLAVYYDFEGDAENVANPGINDGVAIGDATPTAPGRVGSWSATFDGAGDAFNTGFEPVIGPNDSITVMAWVKTTSNDPLKDMYFAGSAALSGSEYLEMTVHHSDFFRSYLRSDNDGGNLIQTLGSPDFMGSTDIADTAWHHLAMVWDGSGSDPVGKLYVDGLHVYTETFDAARAGGSWGTVDFTDAPIFVGAAQFNGGMYGALAGQIDEFAMWMAALTDDEIDQIYRRQSIIP